MRQRIAKLEASQAKFAHAERSAREAFEYAESIINTVREPLVVLGADLRVISASRSFYETFKVIAEDTEGELLYNLGDGQWDIPPLRELLEEILPKNTTIEHFQVQHDFPTIGRRTMILNARRLYKETGETQTILLSIEDITDRKVAKKALKKANDELAKRVEELATANTRLKKEIGERKLAEEQIKASLQEKEVLLKEIHHRVKNNLEIISSLLDMMSMRTDNQEAANLLCEARAKIHTMGLIHSQLYGSDRFDKIDMVSYVRQLVGYLWEVYGAKKLSIIPVIEPSDIYLSVTQAIPCALVLNEVICNALKHAFREEQKGTIQISTRRSVDDTILLKIKDDGMGMPQGVDIYKTDGLGLKLVRNLIQHQLKGKIEVERNNGTEIIIEFKASEEEAKYA